MTHLKSDVAAELRLLAELPATDGAARDMAHRLLLLVRHRIDPTPGLTTGGQYVDRVIPDKLTPPERVVVDVLPPHEPGGPERGEVYLETDEPRGKLPTERVDQLAEADPADLDRHRTCAALIEALQEARKGNAVDRGELVALADRLEGVEQEGQGEDIETTTNAATGPDVGAEPPQQPKRPASKRRDRAKWLGEALILLKDHPEWSDAEIARKVGIHPGNLSRCLEFQMLTQLSRGAPSDRPAGAANIDPDTGQRDVDGIVNDPTTDG